MLSEERIRMRRTNRQERQHPNTAYIGNWPGLRVRESTYEAGTRMRRHVDGVARLSIVLAGALRETAARRVVLAQAGAIVLKGGDAEHATEIGESGSRVFSVELPSDACEAGDSVYRWRQDPAGLRAAYALWHAAQGGDLRATHDRMYDCLGLMTASGPWQAPPRWLLDVKSCLEDGWDAPPGTATMAARAGCHPVYLARAFRRAFGCTIGEFSQWQRVRRVMESVHAGRHRARLVDIAQHAGYFDQSHMCREVRRWTGLAPASWLAPANR